MRFAAVVAALILVPLASSRLTAAEPLRLAPVKGVVLLRNGEVFSGTIARTGDYYHVSKPGSYIRLKAAEVDHVAGNLTELYEVKRRRVTEGKLQDRLDLAEWCVAQRLEDQAKAELAAAAAIAPQHPRIALLERRIDLVGGPPEERAPPSAVVAPGPSKEELDRLVRGMPAHAVESFTTTIQPLLVNNCTTSGCHGPTSPGKLRMFRLSPASPANRRLTQRNLHSVWQVVDANEPAASPLLTAPIRPHGKAKGPIFSGHEAAQYRQLVAWVYAATRQRGPQPPTNETDSTPVAALAPHKKMPKPRPAPLDASHGALDEQDATEEPDEVEMPVPPSEPAGATPAASDSDASEETLEDDDYVPVDPFDPEIFNRRFLRR